MDDNLTIFLLMVVAIAAAVVVTVLTAFVRGKQSVGGAKAERRLVGDEGPLKGHAGRLEERVAVLERIATDPAERTAREIEKLR